MTEPTPEQVQQWYNEWFDGNFDVKPEEYMTQQAYAASAASMQPEIDGFVQAVTDRDAIIKQYITQLAEAQAALRSAQYAMEYAKDECEPTAQRELTIGLLNVQKALK